MSQKRKVKEQGTGKPLDRIPQGEYRKYRQVQRRSGNTTRKNMTRQEQVQKFSTGGSVINRSRGGFRGMASRAVGGIRRGISKFRNGGRAGGVGGGRTFSTTYMGVQITAHINPDGRSGTWTSTNGVRAYKGGGPQTMGYGHSMNTAPDPGGGDAHGTTCVLSTAAYKQGLMTSDELMSFVRWRMTSQKNEFLSEQKWLGYQITWKPISNLMLKSKTFAKLINNTLLRGWKGRIAGNKAYLTRFIIEGSGLVGYALRPNKVKELKQSLKALGMKGILKSYKNLIKSVEG